MATLIIDICEDEENLAALKKAVKLHNLTYEALPTPDWCPGTNFKLTGLQEHIEAFLLDPEFGYCTSYGQPDPKLFAAMCANINL